jgi:hypothetical protein
MHRFKTLPDTPPRHLATNSILGAERSCKTLQKQTTPGSQQTRSPSHCQGIGPWFSFNTVATDQKVKAFFEKSAR